MSATRKSDRKPKANTRLNDLVDSSPTQARSQPASRKRKASGGHAPPARRRRQRRQKTPEETNVETEPEDDEDEDEGAVSEDPDSLELVDLVVRYLDVNTKDPVVAAEQHANLKITENGEMQTKAYGKICGREWTYYVRTTRITLGRGSDDGVSEPSESVEIDLGPSKHVSRKHAQIYFDTDEVVWRVQVYGRNGVKLNEGVVKMGESSPIHSGDVIGVNGTQMLFQAASEKAVIHQMFMERIDAPEKNVETNAINKAVNGQPLPTAPLNQTPNGTVQPQQHSPYGPPVGAYGQVPLAPAPVSYPLRPVTPTKTPQKTQPPSSKKRSPTGQYRRGILMESTETIDYAADSSRDLKPGCSYAAMITWAILSTRDEQLSLSGIYDWIKRHYAYYRLTPSGWQNSIRHNLSLNPAFEKVARRSNEPGKGMKWCIVPEKRGEAISAADKNLAKGGGRTSSAPGSPAGAPVMGGGFPNQQQPVHLPNGSPASLHPPQTQPQSGPLLPPPPQQQQNQQQPYQHQQSLSSFTAPQPTSQQQPPGTPTPPHPPPSRLPIYAPTQGPSFPALSEQASPLRARSSARLPSALDSSPVFNSQPWHSGDYPTNTPAPRAHNLISLQPNTDRLPTSHMIESSPAPFWKYTGQNDSTPPQAMPDSSPVKPNGTTRGMMNAFPSSSPPPPPNGVGVIGTESPTRKAGTGTSGSRPVSSSKAPGSAVASATADKAQAGGDELRTEEDNAIDLFKGFAPISKFHEQRVASATKAVR